jgi:hypothetical protein
MLLATMGPVMPRPMQVTQRRARTAMTSQAALAKKRTDGQWFIPEVHIRGRCGEVAGRQTPAAPLAYTLVRSAAGSPHTLRRSPVTPWI